MIEAQQRISLGSGFGKLQTAAGVRSRYMHLGFGWHHQDPVCLTGNSGLTRIGAVQGLYLERRCQKQASWVRITGCDPRNRTSGKIPLQTLNTLQHLSPGVKVPNFSTQREVRPDTCPRLSSVPRPLQSTHNPESMTLKAVSLLF